MPTTAGRFASRTRLFGVIAIFAFMLAAGIYYAWSPTPVKATTSELFFSEYIEGTSNNKALEIYNDTGAPVNMPAYSVQMFFNGSATAGLTIPLTGTVAQGDVFVLAQSSAAAAILLQADQTNGSGWYNGDDAVALVKGTTIVDVIGQIGVDPGTEWGTGLTSTADNTIRRKSTVCAGDTNGSNAFDPSIEWDGFATDTFSGLGAHSATCGVNQAISPSCPATLSTNEGTAASTGVSATDADGTVTSAAITSTPVAGITLTNFVPAAGVAGTATATLSVANTTAAGTYNVVIQYANNDPSPETATCTVVVTVTAVTPTPSPSPTPVPGSVVLSQVYGGGGNAGATLKNDFIEILNHTNAPIDLTGWSVQYASATLDNWQVTNLNGVTIQPGQYHLIQEAAGAGGTVDLPTPDTVGVIAVGSTAGKIALVSNTTALTGMCPSGTSIIDFVGYGGANCSEGSPLGLLSNTTAALRKNNGCLDTNHNSTDFVIGEPAPRNSSSPTNNCTGLFATGSANPFGVQPGDSSTLTVVVTPGTDPPSTGIAVTADLSAIGGSPSQAFSGVGNTFSFLATVSVGTTPGAKSLPVTVTDAQSRSTTASIALIVQQPHVVISQVYGGGGNASATYSNDFVELYNPSGLTFDLTGWSLQYTSAAGDGWEFTRQPLGGSIGPGQYYLISLASGGAVGLPLPPANILGDINMSATTGKVALVNNFDALEGTCPLGDVNIVDFVGYGATANCAETANAPAPSNTTAILRLNNGTTDTDNNQNDFATGVPNPRRTAPIVEIGPAVFSTDPRNNGVNAPRDANITVNFTEPVDVVGNWFNINCATTGLHNDATFAGANKSYIIIPNVNFLAGEQCTVTILKDQIHDQDTDDSGPNTDTLAADYVFTFTVSTGTAPPYPPIVHLTMGNPNGATADINQPNNYLMEKPEFALSYNRDNGRPNWVSWHLADEWIGTLTRVDTFRADPAVLPTWYRVLGTDFSNSGFDRGHMTPNADRDKETSIPINQATFLMTNMVAQSPDNNQGPWADFENFLRTLLPTNEVYIVAGPAGSGGSGSNGFATTIANGHVLVPSSTWKVVLVIPKGVNDVSRVNANTRTIAIQVPNVQGIRTNPWEQYLTTVDAIENLTGYDFFSNVPDAIENAIEAGTNGVNHPGTAGQSVTSAEDTSVNITLDAVSPGGPLSYTIVNSPAHGSLAGANGSRDYTPDPNFFGTDSFTFKVNDGSNDSNTSTIQITVTEVNDAPTAVDDANSTNEDTTLNFEAAVLTGNDSAGPANESGQSLTVTTVNATGNTHGTVSLNGGQISYSPESNFNGSASFEYQVCDNGTTNGNSDSLCATGTVNITVNPVNDEPTANSQSVSTNGNTPVSITLTGADVETAPASLTFTVTSGPSHGGLSGTAPNLTYTPATNYTGPDSFKFTVTDTGDGAAAALTSTEATVSITVNDTVPPTITAPPNVNLGTGAGATSCSLVISDATLGTATAADNSGSVSVSRSGVPAGNVFPVGTTTITYTATDPSNNSTSATQTVTVFDNTAPVLTAPPPSSATANGSGQAPVPNVLPQVVASDNCSGVTLQQSPTAGTLVGVGTHTITITGTDAAGNPATVTTTFTVNPNTTGLTFSLSVTPSIVKRGKIATLNASFNNGTGTVQRVTFKIRYNSPCGSATIGNIGPIPIAAGAHGSTSLPFLVPKNACTGVYTLTLESYVGGVLVNSTTATLTVTP